MVFPEGSLRKLMKPSITKVVKIRLNCANILMEALQAKTKAIQKKMRFFFY